MTWILASGIGLLVGAVLALTLPGNSLRAWAAIASQALACVLVLAVAIPVLSTGTAIEADWAWSFPIKLVRLRLDPLGAFFLVWSLPMTLFGSVYATGYLAPWFKQGRNGGSHFALLNMISLSFVMVYTLENAMVFLLGWEIAAVAAWLLVIWDYRNQKIRFAGFNYLISTHVGMFVLVAAFMVMHSQTASMDFRAFAAFLGEPSSTRNVVFLLLVTSFGLKSAFFPFHTWLPRAHSAAPAHVSALMSGVIHKAGLFGLLRFLLLIEHPEPWMGWYLIAFSSLSAVLGVLYTSAQRDLKRLLGYSSTENVGIAGIGFGVGTLGLCWNQPVLVMLGFTGGILHVLNHALFKCLLFYAAGAIYRSTHTVDIERLGGLARSMPRTAIFFLVGGLAISAVPPFNGFVSEILVYASLLGGVGPTGEARVAFVVVAAVLAFVGAVSALSMTRAFGIAFLGQPRDAKVHVESDAPAPLFVTMLLHAAGIAVIGLWPAAGLAIVKPAAALFSARLDPAAPMPDPAMLLAPITRATLVLAGAILVFVLLGRWLQRRAAVHVTWGCGYGAPNTRMQYSGTSFSSQFANVFRTLLPQLRREELPRGYFPQAEGRVATHHVDAVERRMFAVLGEGESIVARIVGRIPNEPRIAFAAGMIALGVIGGLLVLRGGS